MEKLTNILITGAAGNIGGALVRKLIENKKFYVVGIDNLSTGNLKNLPKGHPENFKFIKCDVNDAEDIIPVLSVHLFDYVFHYAATVGVQRTLENPIKVLNDIDGFKNIFSLCKNTGVKRVFFSSSSEIYGDPVEFPQKEDTTPLNSRLTYATVKNIGECYLKAYKKEYDLNYTIFRFFNTYGPNQSKDFVIPRFIKAALANKDITIYGDGKQSRTFCYIDDNIDTTIKIMQENLYVNDIVNIGNDQETTILDLAKKVIQLTGSQSRIIHLPPLKEGDMMRREPDNTKMKNVLQRELVPVDEGIIRTIKSLKHVKEEVEIQYI